MSLFQTSKTVVLLNGGYVSDASDKKPVTHQGFIAAQTRAHYLVTLAAKMKGKTFTATPVENINHLMKEVSDDLATEDSHEFVTAKAAPVGTLTAQLRAEALAFCGAKIEENDVDTLNNKLQEFKLLVEFETQGLFFTKGISKLNKIYTVKEIIKAAKTIMAVTENF